MIRNNTLRRALNRASSHRTLAFALAGFGLAFAAAIPAQAQTSTAPVNLDLGAVLSTGTGSAADLATTPGTAPYEAPSLTPLNATQPTSVVNKNTISNQFIGTASYADIATLTPSVSTISPNGQGLSEANGPSIRGFQDGMYNVTFDGIPFGDSNDFTHHSTSFFTDSQIGQVIVDRGPGTAETVGDATFGGTISVRTIDPSATRSVTPYGEWGSYDTNLGGVTLNTGSIQSANGTSAVVDAEHIKSNGALTNTGQERSNFFGKVVIPVGNNTTVTLLADYNHLYQNFDSGATADQIAAYGSNYGNSGDPTSQSYYKYNSDHITTDMEYIDVQSNLNNGLLYDGKIYTYGYYHHGLNGLDYAGGIPNLVQYSPTGPEVTGVAGQQMKMDYRSVGTIQRLEKDFDWGDIKTGVWFDHQVNTRYQGEVILNSGYVPNYDLNTTGNSVTSANNFGTIDRLQHNQLYTFQPYGQLDWKPIDGLTLTAGLKYAFFKRALNAPVNQGTGIAQYYQHNYDRMLPSFEAKYSFNPNLSAYAQAAEGFLAPNLNTLYTANLTANALKPQTTLNFQTGMAYQDQHLALGGDLYNIHFQNKIQSAGSGNNKYFTNVGGAIYRGVEGEATYTFDSGFAVFANGGYNQAFKTHTNVNLTQAPQFTSNFGVIYDKNGIYGSVIDQWVGGEYSGTGTASGKSPGGWYDPHNVVNVAAGYTFNHLNPSLSQIKMKLNVDNITNQKQPIFDNGTDAAGQPLYFVLPGVSAFVSLSVPINF